MYGAEVFTDLDVFNAVNEAIVRSPGFMNVQTQRLFQRNKAAIKSELFVEPPLPTLPFVWSLDPAANARARRWYFANRVPPGSEGGRYPRTGALLDAFDILLDTSESSTIFVIVNDAPGAEFVIGNRQVPSHARSGWGNLDETALRASERLTDNLIDLWYTVLDATAGI